MVGALYMNFARRIRLNRFRHPAFRDEALGVENGKMENIQYFFQTSSSLIISWTSFGLALPWETFMACPTRKPMDFLFPFL